MPVYTNAGQAKSHVNQQVAILNNPAQKLTVSNLRYHMREVIANLPNIPEDQMSGLQSGLIRLFAWLPEIGKHVMASEIDLGCHSLSYEYSNLLDEVIVDGLEQSVNLSEKQKKVFEAARSRRSSDDHARELTIAQAQLSVSQAQCAWEEKKRIQSEKEYALERTERSARAEARADAAIGSILGGGLTALGTGLCIACPASAQFVISARVAVGATAVATVAGGAGGYSYGYAQHRDSLDNAQLAVTNAKIEFESAQRVLTNAKNKTPNAIADVVLRLGN